MNRVRVGIVGTGFSACAHIEALRRVPHVDVVAVASRNIEKAEKLASTFRISKAYGDAADLINDPEIDAVHNCTPTYMHYEINRRVLLAKKHLLSEKPLALNSEESATLMKLAEQSDVVSAVCFNYRHYPLVAEMKEMILEKQFGKVNLVYGGYIQDWLLYDTDYNWRLDPEFNGPSRAIADIGSHWCDTVQHVLGKKIINVFADLKTVHETRKKPKKEVSTFGIESEIEAEVIDIHSEDYGSVLVHFEGGAQGVFTVSQVSGGRKNHLHFDIAMEKATLSWNQEEANRLWIGQRDEPNRELVKDPNLLSSSAAELAHYPGGHQEGWPDGLKNLFIDFYQAIQHKKQNQPYSPKFATIADGHQSMCLIEAILESHQTKKWVDVANRRLLV